MDDKSIIEARIRAERAVEGMKDPSLKLKAFEQVFGKLLGMRESADSGAAFAPHESSRSPRPASASTLAGRLQALQGDGFFTSQRTLSEIREELGSRGWHYPLTTLSGVMQRLVRRRELRRERVKEGSKKVWKYVRL